MLKLKSDYEELRGQLSSIGYGEETKETKAIADAVVAVCLTLSEIDLELSSMSVVLQLLNPESRTIIESWHRAHSGEMWADFDYGNTKIGDYVRIKKDAYDSVSGSKHNGLVGKLTHMRGGKCSVDYLGLAAGNSSQHPMEKLESIKRV